MPILAEPESFHKKWNLVKLHLVVMGGIKSHITERHRKTYKQTDTKQEIKNEN